MNATTGLYSTFFRDYDPVLGRFLQVDPLAVLDNSLSSYVYGGNNPVFFNDPLGDKKKPKRPTHNSGGYGDSNNYTGGDGRSGGDSGSGGGFSDDDGGGSPFGGSQYLPGNNSQDTNFGGGSWANTIYTDPNGKPTSQEIFTGLGKQYHQKGPETTFEILHSSIRDKGGLDWFLETTKTPTSGGYKWLQRAVILTYDKKGNLVDYIGKQRTFVTFEYGTLDQYDAPTRYNYKPYELSPQMLGVIAASINYNCGGCLTDQTLVEKYFDFIMSPIDTQKKNRLKAVSSPHR